MIVADTNLVASLYFETGGSELAERVLRADSDWRAPFLWRSELRNALSVLVRGERFSLGFALEVIEAAERQLRGCEYSIPSPAVLLLTDESRCSAYDCEFVALANELGVPLVTLDREIIEAFPQVAISPQRFLEQ
ncbi:MAG: type II toxin-antitoxin system VapC family toxin [Acidobacteriota bacterium]